jgi:tricorn protease
MKTTSLLSPFLLALLAGPLAGQVSAQVRPDAVLLRTPDVSAGEIAFRYAGDLWIVDKRGGEARRLTSGPGNESMPKFSPDGEVLAFVGGYDGGSDLYTMRIDAGRPERISHHPAMEVLCDWTKGGRELLFWARGVIGHRTASLFRVPAEGGQPEKLPVPYGTFGAIDATGTWLAYTPGSREFRTWKRYQGGRAQDIWLFNLRTHQSRRITDHPGTDSLPMWHGREVIFLSDRGPEARRNLHAFDLKSGETRRLTDFSDCDVSWPSIGPDDIVFEAGGKLWRLELATGESVEVVVSIPGERPHLRARTHQLGDALESAFPGPSGARVVTEARGEIFSVPVEEGITRNLTRSSGVAERAPSWSPDGKWIAYFSDRSGEYELTLRRSDGKSFEGADERGERRVTEVGPGWKERVQWAPDSGSLVFSTNDGALRLFEMESGALRTIALDPGGDPLTAAWSADSSWLAWSHRHSQSRLSAIFLHQITEGVTLEVTSGHFSDHEPAFDLSGDWLYYVSDRSFEPTFDDDRFTWIFANTSSLVAVPLREDVENPWALEDAREEIEEDEEEPGSEVAEASDGEAGETTGEITEEVHEAPAGEASAQDVAKDPGGEEEKDGEDEAPLEIDISGFEARAILLPVDPGRLGNLEGGEQRVAFVQSPRAGGEGGSSLHFFDMEEKEEQTVLDGVSGAYYLLPGAEKVLVFARGSIGVVSFAPGQKFEAIDLSGMTATIDPREEWKQLLADVFRIYRDFFYEEGMHGVDWRGIWTRYDAALEAATSRSDVALFTGEMISELNVGHAYNDSPSDESAISARPIGLLGCDWSLEKGAFRIARILGSEGPYDLDARSPLAEHGIDVAVGDWLLEVNGIPLDPGVDVYAAFEGTAGRPTELTVNANPRLDGEERRVLVRPLRSERNLRYRDWVSRNRARVEELGGGRVGYLHVPNTGGSGLSELTRQFLGARHKEALIIDERWNAGGQLGTRFIELLGRDATNHLAPRHGAEETWPSIAHFGPQAMLINGWAGSGGDAFPYLFRQAGLGKLIGRRTWGGLVGISGNPSLVDGSRLSVPRIAFFELDGTWGVEGYGVPPDIEVIDDPALMLHGGDPQLEAAVRHLLEELEGWTFPHPTRPEGPDRRGAGIPIEDR